MFFYIENDLYQSIFRKYFIIVIMIKVVYLLIIKGITDNGFFDIVNLKLNALNLYFFILN